MVTVESREFLTFCKSTELFHNYHYERDVVDVVWSRVSFLVSRTYTCPYGVERIGLVFYSCERGNLLERPGKVIRPGVRVG